MASTLALCLGAVACADDVEKATDSGPRPTQARDAGRDAGDASARAEDAEAPTARDGGMDASIASDGGSSGQTGTDAGVDSESRPDGGTTELDASRGASDAGPPPAVDSGLRVDGGGNAGANDGGNATLSFFITSVGLATGGNLGGLFGADAHCQTLAAAVGAGSRTWRAYLSTSGVDAVHARDRIGKGPWFNQKGVRIANNVAQLHANNGMNNDINLANGLDEKGAPVPVMNPNEHDILSGSSADGMALPQDPDRTCRNWTSSASGDAGVQVGHHNKAGGGAAPMSWNSAHANTMGCSLANLKQTGGAGRFYCFAAD